jgi:hypothetical protein
MNAAKPIWNGRNIAGEGKRAPRHIGSRTHRVIVVLHAAEFEVSNLSSFDAEAMNRTQLNPYNAIPSREASKSLIFAQVT